MKHLRLALSLVAAALIAVAAAQSGPQTFKGHLVDTVCAVGHANKPGYAANHDKRCNLMEGCIKSGRRPRRSKS